MPLPFKEKNPPILPNNKNIAVTRLNQLKGRLQRDKTYSNHYFTSMNDFIEKGYVEKEHGNPIEYRMNVHLFGAASSPGCANFGLKELLTITKILQECCSDQIEWDEPPSEILIQRWQQWRNDIQNLAQLGIQRCVKPKDFGNITVCELHHFSDASTLGYGLCSYLRLIDEN
ncbi:unnamed protein product [Mytilus edulis]|uniref:Uncharacterized protein n=1 Tax=Mytilus edulis TaxID=6550 RepID=A0A8S3S8B7_MYTED|nr:unnamed protein product [Mytilus edulis]